MSTNHDILEILADEDIPKLRNLYQESLPHAVHVFNFLNNVIRWKKMQPEKKYITLMVPHGDWSDGTFVSLLQWSCYEIFLFTLEESCQRLCEALIKTKHIDWNRKIFFYALHHNHYDGFLKVAKSLDLKIASEITCNIWRISQENAKQFETDCPSEVYVKKLERSMASTINQLWPHRYENSEEYLATFIEMNGGYGVFLKSNDNIVAWILRANVDTLSVLQTVDDHKKKGYATLVTKVLSKELANEGFDPLGMVILNNNSSQIMFKNMGFEKCDLVIFISTEPNVM